VTSAAGAAPRWGGGGTTKGGGGGYKWGHRAGIRGGSKRDQHADPMSRSSPGRGRDGLWLPPRTGGHRFGGFAGGPGKAGLLGGNGRSFGGAPWPGSFGGCPGLGLPCLGSDMNVSVGPRESATPVVPATRGAAGQCCRDAAKSWSRLRCASS
jgi:hypothetical protein